MKEGQHTIPYLTGIPATAVLVLTVLFCTACHDFNNPVDPKGNNYQGYKTVDSLDDIEAESEKQVSLYSTSMYFMWSEVVGALGYEIIVGSTPYGTNVASTTTSDNYIELDLGSFYDMTLYWTVRGFDAGGGGIWAEPRSFHQDIP